MAAGEIPGLLRKRIRLGAKQAADGEDGSPPAALRSPATDPFNHRPAPQSGSDMLIGRLLDPTTHASSAHITRARPQTCRRST